MIQLALSKGLGLGPEILGNFDSDISNDMKVKCEKPDRPKHGSNGGIISKLRGAMEQWDLSRDTNMEGGTGNEEVQWSSS